MTRIHLATSADAPRDRLAEQSRAGLGIVATCAEASAQLAEGAAEFDTYPAYVRAKIQRASVAFAAVVADLQADIAKLGPAKCGALRQARSQEDRA